MITGDLAKAEMITKPDLTTTYYPRTSISSGSTLVYVIVLKDDKDNIIRGKTATFEALNGNDSTNTGTIFLDNSGSIASDEIFGRYIVRVTQNTPGSFSGKFHVTLPKWSDT